MGIKYVDVRKRVDSVSGMTSSNILYDLIVTDSGLPIGSYVRFNESIVRVASPSPTTIPAGMAHGRVFRAGDYQFRYLGTQNGIPRLEEVSSTFTSRLQIRSSGTLGSDSFVVFDTMDFGPSDFVELDQGILLLASGISHLLQAGAFSSNKAVQLRWGCCDVSGNSTLVGSVCGSTGSGVCGGNAVFTTIPTSDTIYKLELSDPTAIVTDVWATIESQPTFQTVTAPITPTGVIVPPNPVPSGTVPSSGSAPAPSGSSPMGAGFNSSGHIVLIASGTTMYVSSISGSDSNNGLSAASAKATLVAAHNALSNGNNRILLAKGGFYVGPNNGSSSNPQWLRKGLSRAYPFIVGSYGTGEQPRVDGFGATNSTVDYLACEDLFLYIPIFHKGGNGLLLERCKLFAADIQGDRIDANNWLQPLIGVFIRFCKVFDSALNNTGNWQGIFTANVWEVLVEYCVIDHNGWPANITRSAPAASGAPDNLKHNCYFNLPGGPVIFRFNIVGDASSHAVHQRPGGINEWNLYLHNPMAQMGYSADGKIVYAPNGVSGYIADNVAITSSDVTPGLPKGIFFQFNNVNGLIVARNIACFNTTSTANNVMFRQEKSIQGGVLNNITYLNNISYNWSSSPSNGIQTPTSAGSDPTNITTSGNLFESGVFSNPSGALAYVSFSGVEEYNTLRFMSGVRTSGIIIGGSTDPTLIINNIKAMFT